MNDHEDLFDSLFDLEETQVVRSDIQRAPYGYVGAKYRSIPYMMRHLPYRRKWIDHFGGSGVVTLNRQESVLDVFNDRWSGVTCFYQCIRNAEKCKKLINRLELTLHSREEFQFCKEFWINEQDEVERAAQWYYMMRCSVIGKGACFARSTNVQPPIQLHNSLELFWSIHYRFKKVQVENLDFEICFRDYDSHDTVHYCDPPYLGTDKGLYANSWTLNDLQRLIKCAADAKGFVAISHYPHELLDSQKFWTRKVSWEVPITSEVQAYTNENNKKDYKHVQEYDDAKEMLYIKD